jgi:hypothetical protein
MTEPFSWTTTLPLRAAPAQMVEMSGAPLKRCDNFSD